MWHKSVGHWVINQTPGSHGGDLFQSELAALDECPGNVVAWTGTGRVKNIPFAAVLAKISIFS